MAGSFKVLGGMLKVRPFLIWEVLKTIMIRIDPISGSKTFDIFFDDHQNFVSSQKTWCRWIIVKQIFRF